VIHGHYTIPGKPPLFVTAAAQEAARKNGQKTIKRMNRSWQGPCGLLLADGTACAFTCRGAGNMAQHRRKHGRER
jgi:hypothetical protein